MAGEDINTAGELAWDDNGELAWDDPGDGSNDSCSFKSVI